MNCQYCNKHFETKIKTKLFCSKKCRTINSVKNHRAKTKKICNVCNVNKIYHESLTCRSCYETTKNIDRSITIGEYRNKISVKGKHKSWLHSHIRDFNRRWNHDLTLMPCKVCNYSLHVELAHIKSISSFPDSATLEEVNAKSNIIPLCRNCHWEFDNGILKIGIPE